MKEKLVAYDVPIIKIKPEIGESFIIDTVKYYDDGGDVITIECVEFPHQFKRGFMCDITPLFSFRIFNEKQSKSYFEFSETFNNCVLVYIEKQAQVADLPAISFKFYK
jgi:hypothetical protein